MRSIRLVWLMSPSDRAGLEAGGWRECFRHPIYGTVLMTWPDPSLYRGRTDAD